jgi:hypothetical protein
MKLSQTEIVGLVGLIA